MATPQERIEIEILTDTTKLKAGTDEAERSIEALADSVDLASDDMRRSLQSIDDGVSSTLGPSGSFTRATDDFTDTGRQRFSEAGTEVASEFSSNLAEGIASGDTSATLLDSITGLGATLGAAGGLTAIAGVGALVGGAIVSGMVNGAKAAKAEFIAETKTIFDSVEVEAKTSMRKIRKEILEGFTFESVLEELGGEAGLQGGIDQVNTLVDATGVKFNTVVDLLRGKVNPATEETRKILEQQASLINVELAPGVFTMSKAQTDVRDTAKDVLGVIDDQLEKQKTVTQQKKLELDYTRDQVNPGRAVADAMERTALAAERAERAALRLGGNLGNAVRQAGLVNLALGGP